jgi:hypothetical protein
VASARCAGPEPAAGHAHRTCVPASAPGARRAARAAGARGAKCGGPFSWLGARDPRPLRVPSRWRLRTKSPGKLPGMTHWRLRMARTGPAMRSPYIRHSLPPRTSSQTISYSAASLHVYETPESIRSLYTQSSACIIGNRLGQMHKYADAVFAEHRANGSAALRQLTPCSAERAAPWQGAQPSASIKARAHRWSAERSTCRHLSNSRKCYATDPAAFQAWTP